jgi:phage tail-like protein
VALSFAVDPIPNFKYGLEVGGILVGGFMSCSGLETRRETKEVAEGGINDHVHVLPGPLVQGNVTLTRGITFTSFLWEWFHWGMTDTDVLHLPVIIFRYNSGGVPVNIWPILSAYPVKWTGRQLQSGSLEAAVETLELACGSAAGQDGQNKASGGDGDSDKKKKDKTAKIDQSALALKVFSLLQKEIRLEGERAGRMGGF